MAHFLDRFLGDPSKKFIKKVQEQVDQINELETKLEKLSKTELREKTSKLQQNLLKSCPWLPIGDQEKKIKISLENQNLDKEEIKRRRLQEEEILATILPETFALVREGAKRTIKQRHFDVQILGGIALHQGNISEMKTGEGKTLAATLPAFLNALLGYGVHIVTVNDYLAKRDAGWMGQIYHSLGLSVAGIVHEKSYLFEPKASDRVREISRKEAYLADITYGTNSEFGFDYLRDNMAPAPEYINQRVLYYAIVDEVDSILIDEARTPLIISAPAEESASLYQKFSRLVPSLETDKDFTVDEKMRTVSLTSSGIKKMEKALGVENVYSAENQLLAYHMEEALKAHILYLRDRDYVVKESEVIIVDEFTGRLMPGRRYSEGLHQAIEAKEEVEVQRESDTLATISIQNFFRLYRKLSGMTGTASTEAEEFQKIYGMDVVTIPTNQEMIRLDLGDKIYKTEASKFQAIIDEINFRHEKGQPILLGTISIEKNETLGKLLKENGIPHEILNAKNHEREAHIIANAGRLGAVTLATNMAGRGTDIILGGAKPEEKFEIRSAKSETNSKSEILNPKPSEEFDRIDTSNVEEETEGTAPIVADRTLENWQKEHDEVLGLGGLHVIGSERHESRRIDNQLRGRSGRQGDPGSTLFFISMEDDLMRIFGGDRMKRMMDTLGLPDDQPIETKIISRSIESAQKKVEGFNFDSRKHVVEFDDVMEKHRTSIYTKRRKILFNSEKLRDEIVEILKSQGRNLVGQYLAGNPQDWNVSQLSKDLTSLVPLQEDEVKILEKNLNKEVSDTGAEQTVLNFLETAYQMKVEEISEDLMNQVERAVYLRTIDRLWVDHLSAMNALRTGIGLQAYAQTDPLAAYKQEGFYAFQRLVSLIEDQTIKNVLRLQKRDSTEQEAEMERKSLLARVGMMQAGPSENLAGGSINLQQPIVETTRRVVSSEQTAFQSVPSANPVQVAVRKLNQQSTINNQSASASQSTINNQSASASQSTINNQSASASQSTINNQQSNKLGRNDPCYCGSGKKYKKCHGK